MSTCGQCGASLAAGTQFCGQCGAPRQTFGPEVSLPNRVSIADIAGQSQPVSPTSRAGFPTPPPPANLRKRASAADIRRNEGAAASDSSADSVKSSRTAPLEEMASTFVLNAQPGGGVPPPSPHGAPTPTGAQFMGAYGYQQDVMAPAPASRKGVAIGAGLVAVLIIIGVGVGLNLRGDNSGDESAYSGETPSASHSVSESSQPTTTPKDTPRPAPEGAIHVGDSFLLMPSENIACRVNGKTVDCEIRVADYVKPKQPTEELCGAYSWGHLVSLEATGIAVFSCSPPSVFATGGEPTRFEYGMAIRTDDFACTSSEQGVECWALKTGRGFSLARGAQSFR